MSHKNKNALLKLMVSAAFATAAVMLGWMLFQPRFIRIVPVMLVAVISAFIIEAAILMLLKGKRPVKRAFKIIFLFAVNFSVFFSAVIYGFAPAVILQPHSDEEAYRELQNEAFAEEMTFTGKNGSINGWFYNIAGENAPTVLYFYGNYETASTRLLKLTENYENSSFSGCNFAVFDYPAYGKCDGICSDKSILQFSLDVYDNLSRITDEIIVLGYSVGTGPACYLASRRDIGGLILYAPYADGIDLYNNVIDIFHGPLEKLVSFDVPNVEFVKGIKEKSLILCSEADELIPYTSSMKLVTEFGGECTLQKTPDISHNQFLTDSFVRKETKNFIREVTAE